MVAAFYQITVLSMRALPAEYNAMNSVKISCLYVAHSKAWRAAVAEYYGITID